VQFILVEEEEGDEERKKSGSRERNKLNRLAIFIVDGLVGGAFFNKTIRYYMSCCTHVNFQQSTNLSYNNGEKSIHN
jgi:hypothetical protein